MPQDDVSATKFQSAFVLILALATSALFLAVTWPFVTPLLLGCLLAGLCQPLYQWLLRLLRGRKSLAAVLTVVLLFLLVTGPISAFIGVVLQQALEVSDQAIPWVKDHLGSASAFNAHDWLVQLLPSLSDFIPEQEKIAAGAARAAQAAGSFLVSGAGSLTAGTASFLLGFFVMLYAMFFFLREGGAILEKILYYTPLDHEDEVRVLQRFKSITRATIKGTLVIGAIQGALAGIGFRVAGIEGAAFWGTVMAVLSVVPGIGAALVWIPAVVYLYLTGQTWTATLLLAWCAGMVGTIDNVLRPRLVGKDAEIPDLLILVGTLGGLFFFGPIGFILGPLVCGLFLTVWEIYGTTFKNLLPPVHHVQSGEARTTETKPSARKKNESKTP